MAKVSILIPVYNTEKYIAQAIESVLQQSYAEFELIIVDDCSSDSTYEICAEYAEKDKRISLFRNEVNLGMMANWNYGLSLCDGEYWGKLDADDIWHPEFVEACVEILDSREDVGLVCSEYVNINPEGKEIEGSRYHFPSIAKDNSISMGSLVKKGIREMFSFGIAQQGVGLMRSRIIEEYGPFLDHPAGDSEMWFRIGGISRVYCLSKRYHYHRIWPENFTRTRVLSSGKSEKNLYEIRSEILKFYRSQGLIARDFQRREERLNRFEYYKYLNYRDREKGDYLRVLGRMIRMFLMHPGETLSFYWKRIQAG